MLKNNKEIANSTHEQWSSKFAFVLAATGAAVGLGNIWKFPYITGENGGGAFIIVYLACVMAIGIPIMIAEIMLGRRGKHSPINTIKILAQEANAENYWRYLGWMGVLAGFLILSYYSVVAGWAIDYMFKAINGSFSGAGKAQIEHLFNQLIKSPQQLMLWHSVFMLITMGVVAQGIRGGLEKSVCFLMPALLVLLLLLLAYSMNSPSYQQGLDFMFNADFSKINGESILTAMGHAFFTLGVGMGAVMIYGAYLPKNISIAKTSIIVAGADTIVALLAGIIIFPLVFANGLEPSSGPGLIFQTLPIAFGQMYGGFVVGIMFFVLLVFAALTSSISLIEPAVAWLIESYNWTRKKACIVTGTITWLLGLGSVFSFNIWADFTIFDKNIFNLVDYITSNLMLPLSAFFIAIFAGWIMHKQDSQAELELSSISFKCWRFLICYVAPIAVFIVFLQAINVL